MAGVSLLVLLDDIATTLDDIAAMTKVAAGKTAGVLGDDLALNAQQVVGVRAERELPVVWAVFKGSLRNKAILVPAALLISLVLPTIIMPMLMLGGAFLCYEGFEKVFELLFHPPEEKIQKKQANAQKLKQTAQQTAADIAAAERKKIRGAIRTDFILSAEIIVITLGIVSSAPLLTQFVVLAAIAVSMTAGVYGLVAVIVKIDDIGLALSQRHGDGLFYYLQRNIGHFLLAAAPKLMHLLSVVGTIAMFLVGGGILRHGIASLDHLKEAWLAPLSGLSHSLGGLLIDGIIGLIAGAALLGLVHGVSKIYRALRPSRQ